MTFPTLSPATRTVQARAQRRARRSAPGLAAMALLIAAAFPAGAAAAGNLPPVAVDDPAAACAPASFGGSFPIAEDSAQFGFTGSCSAIANDTDSDGAIVAWEVVDPPAHGTLEWLGDFPSAFGYTPDPDWSTPAGDWVSDSFTYRAVDDEGATSNVATYRFWIAPFNDAPSFEAGSAIVVAPADTAYSAAWATNVSPGPANESGQAVHFEMTDLTYLDNPALFDLPPEVAPDGTLTFTPAPGQRGSVSVTFVAKDDGGLEHYPGVPDAADDTSDPVTFQITVIGNSSPEANDDVATVDEDSVENTIQVLENDSDADQDTLAVIAVSNASQGFARFLEDGSAVTYTPNPDATGTDQFAYTISDGNGHEATAFVDVTITPANDPPDAVDDGALTPIPIGKGAGPVPIAVLANDTSTPDDGETLVISAVTQGAHGNVTIGGDGSLTYDPNGQTIGPDTFTYTIDDGNGGMDTATVFVQVAKDATAPIVTGPVAALNGQTQKSKVGLTVSWTAQDPESGVAANQLQMRRAGDSWSTVSLADPKATRADLFVAPGYTYEFRVRATNGASPSTTSPYATSLPLAV
jgi:Big-like domain-containing protein